MLNFKIMESGMKKIFNITRLLLLKKIICNETEPEW